MKIGGIIAEYNPFHNGHRYQLEKSIELGQWTHTVAVMSSNFVQRGETAVFSKWARAEMAIRNGVDLVIELPVLWSSSHAQRFAMGGVSLLDALGCVDMISFGSESGNIDELIECKNALKSEAVEERLKENLEIGLGYAPARAEALGTIYGSRLFSVLEGANNSLAIEYLNALDELKSEIIPMAIRRTGAVHDSIVRKENFASASEIRRMMLNNEKGWERYVPQAAVDVICREEESSLALCSMEKLEFSVLCCLRKMSAEEIALAPDVSEGIEYRIHEASLRAGSLEELYQKAKTRRYSHARIRRIILHSFLGIKAQECTEAPPYVHVLAMNNKGKEILKEAKDKAKLPIITKASDYDGLEGYAQDVFRIESMCTDIYSLSSPVIQHCGREKTQGIIVLK